MRRLAMLPSSSPSLLFLPPLLLPARPPPTSVDRAPALRTPSALRWASSALRATGCLVPGSARQAGTHAAVRTGAVCCLRFLGPTVTCLRGRIPVLESPSTLRAHGLSPDDGWMHRGVSRSDVTAGGRRLVVIGKRSHACLLRGWNVTERPERARLSSGPRPLGPGERTPTGCLIRRLISSAGMCLRWRELISLADRRRSDALSPPLSSLAT